MPAKWDKFLKHAALEYLSNGEKGVDKISAALEKATKELARPTTEPESAQSTGVSYSTSPGIVERRAQFVPQEVVDGSDGRNSLDINSPSVPLLSQAGITSQNTPLLTVPEQRVQYSEPGPEARVSNDATNATVPGPLLAADVGPSPPEFPLWPSPAQQQDSFPHSEGLNSGTTNNLSTAPSSEPFSGPSQAMPVAEVVPAHSALVTSTEVPAGSHPRRTWNSRVPTSDEVTSRETRTSPTPDQSTQSPAASGPTRASSIIIKVTGYRILNTAVVLTLGIWKGVASYRNESILSNTLDILLGVVCAVGLYWLGFFETSDPPCLIWLFHKDYAAALRRSLKRRLSTPGRMSAGPLPYTSHDV